MTGLWLLSYLVLWGVVVGEGLVILALARETNWLRGQVETGLHPSPRNEAKESPQTRETYRI